MSRRQQLHKFVIKAAYYYSLVLGLLPGQYDRRTKTFKVKKAYLCYSAVMQLMILLITPLSSPYFRHSHNFMDRKPILQWTYIVGKAVRVLTIVFISGQIWLQRQNLRRIFQTYQSFLAKYGWFYAYFDVNFTPEFAAERQRLQQFVFLKFLTLQLNPLIIQINFLRHQKEPDCNYYILIVVNSLQTLYLVVACLLMTLVLCEIQWNFFCLNKALELLNGYRFSKRFLYRFYGTIYEMYVNGHQLAGAWLEACNTVILFMLMKMFTTNIVIIYHMVLMAMRFMPTDSLMMSMYVLCLVMFYWDNFLVTLAADKALSLANGTANVLSATWIEVEAVRELDFRLAKCITQVLNQFSDYLACHKLKFCIFGLVNFDKACSFQYFVAAILHLIILVQFDLQTRQKI